LSLTNVCFSNEAVAAFLLDAQKDVYPAVGAPLFVFLCELDNLAVLPNRLS